MTASRVLEITESIKISIYPEKLKVDVYNSLIHSTDYISPRCIISSIG